MHVQLASVVAEYFTFEHYVDDNMRNIPDHYHAHARPKGGFFGHGLAAQAAAAPMTSAPVTDHVLTIDLGTSGPKVALFTLDGTFVDGDFTPVELQLLADGGVEQSPAAWWDGHRRRVATARWRVRRCGPTTLPRWPSRRSGRARSPIDRDGTPLHDAIIWMDARGADRDPAHRRRPDPGAGLRPAQAAHLDHAHRRRARAVGQGLDLAHPLVADASGPTSPAPRGSTSSRRTG